MAESSDWEVTKENIQPIHQRRKQAILQNVLTSKSDELSAQKQYFEDQLRSYDGKDPLDIRQKYLNSVEQSHRGKEQRGRKESHGVMFVLNTQGSKENEKKVSKSNKAKASQEPASRAKKPEFVIHQDASPCNSTRKASQSSEHAFNPSLAIWKEKSQPRVALFEPPDPMKKRMYDFNKVYGGPEEFSFEQIRAAKYWANFQRQKELEEKEIDTLRARPDKLELKSDVPPVEENIRKENIPNIAVNEYSEDEVYENVPPSNYVDTYLAELDPFDTSVTDAILQQLEKDGKPVASCRNFYTYNRALRIKPGNCIRLGKISCSVTEEIAEGAYAKIFAAVPDIAEDLSSSLEPEQSLLALKVCRNTKPWEYYICSELQKRLREKAGKGNEKEARVFDFVVDMMACAMYKNSMVLVSKLGLHGTVLDIINIYRQNAQTGKSKHIPECITMYFAIEMLTIMSRVHECDILHCDVKPDNFLINNFPSKESFAKLTSLDDGEKTFCLQLIDFGRAIDLSSFTPGIMFDAVVTTDAFQCIEMNEKRPWVHQSDWYGIMGCIHILLFSEYMKVEKDGDGFWRPSHKFPRYYQVDIWQPMFKEFLNMPSCYQVPDVKPYVDSLIQRLRQRSRFFTEQAKEFHTIGKARKSRQSY